MKQIVLAFAGLMVFTISCAQIAPASKTAVGTPSPGDTTWTAKITKSNEEWKKLLTPSEYQIARQAGTEPAYSNNGYNNHDKGMYYCACCSNPLFSSATKFDSGTGWPSFWRAYSTKSVSKSVDNSLGVTRDEISCKRCGAHLGHVFDDGPNPTGLRYCMNGAVLYFKKDAAAH